MTNLKFIIAKVKGFGIVNKAEIDVFLELSCFFHDPADVGNLVFVLLYPSYFLSFQNKLQISVYLTENHMLIISLQLTVAFWFLCKIDI